MQILPVFAKINVREVFEYDHIAKINVREIIFFVRFSPFYISQKNKKLHFQKKFLVYLDDINWHILLNVLIFAISLFFCNTEKGSDIFRFNFSRSFCLLCFF